MKYLNVGISAIDLKKFEKVKNTNTTKPKGGIWTTNYYPNYSPWIDYICRYKEFLEEKYKGYNASIPGVIITLKDDAKIYKLDSIEKLEYLKKQYPYPNWFNYNALANDYDAITIELANFKKLENDPFESFGISTTIILNPNSIEYFEEINITIEEIKMPYNSIYEHFITKSNTLKRTKPSI